MPKLLPIAAAVLALAACTQPQPTVQTAAPPGTRVLLDAHNCYPYHGRWADRIDRALATGAPLAIEQDLAWYTDSNTGRSWSILTHEEPYTGDEPTLRDHFFERIRPIVEQALSKREPEHWPLITLNLDFKSNEPEHHAAIWELLGDYQEWLCTAERVADPAQVVPLDPKPVLVLTGDSDAQEKAFHTAVAPGDRLRLFGAVAVNRGDRNAPDEVRWQRWFSTPPVELVTSPATNYRRWWNNSWYFVEEGGATRAGDWTSDDNTRLRSLVDHAHSQGLWIRFYTLNGHDPNDDSGGWGAGYNFGALDRAKLRWKAAVNAGVDFIATDQYEDLSAILNESAQAR